MTSRVRGNAGTEGAVGDHLEAQDGVEGDGQEHPGHESGDGGGCLAVGVGQPAVHRHETDLGAVSEHDEGEAQTHHPGVEPVRLRHERRPVEGVRSVPDGMQRGQVDEHRAQERHGDPDRADDDVLPRRLERRPGPAMSDQEGGDHRGGLDGHPQHAEVGGQHGQEHRGQERLDEDAVERGVATRAAAGGDLGVEIAHALPRGQHGDDPDDDDHEGAERIGPQDPAESRHRAAVHDVDGQHDPRHEHPRGGGRAEPAEAAPPRRRRHTRARTASGSTRTTTSISRAAR